MDDLSSFDMPKQIKVTGRTSSIGYAFNNSIIPSVQPTESEVEEALSILGMTPEKIECAYCGAPKSGWNHLRPLISKKKPTGYISEICNLVPSCGKCSQSKGSKEWQTWMKSSAKLSPKTQKVPDRAKRFALLQKYEEWKEPIKVDFEKVVGEEAITAHFENCIDISKRLKKSQTLAEKIRQQCNEHCAKKRAVKRQTKRQTKRVKKYPIKRKT